MEPYQKHPISNGMKLLAEISDATLGIGEPEQLDEMYELRKSARAILLNENGEMAVQYLQNHFFHKLPGGGVENGESREEAVRREIKEEVGCECVVKELIGVTIEYRAQYKMIHISYCFVAEVDGPITEPHLEQGEIEEGMITLWMKPVEALKKMEIDTPNTYQGPFILKRELAFLREYTNQYYEIMKRDET